MQRSFQESRRLNTIDAAAYLGIGASTLTKLRLTGGGPIFLKITRRRVVYDIRDLDQWADSRRRRSTSDTGEVTKRDLRPYRPRPANVASRSKSKETTRQHVKLRSSHSSQRNLVR